MPRWAGIQGPAPRHSPKPSDRYAPTANCDFSRPRVVDEVGESSLASMVEVCTAGSELSKGRRIEKKFS